MSFLRPAIQRQLRLTQSGIRGAHCVSFPFPKLMRTRLHSNLVDDHRQKYADRLLEKAKAEGYASVEEMTAALREAKRRQQAAQNVQETSGKAAKSTTSSATSHTHKSRPTSSIASSGKADETNRLFKPLDQILNMEKMAEADAETVGKLWTEYHAQKNHLSAVIPAGSYRELYQRTSRYPRFVLPVPHADGIEVYYCQFHFHQAYFTPLLEYKTHGESAKTYLTLTNYTEFLDSKGIVLMRGELTDPKLPLSMDSAHLLTLAVQQFYLTGSAAKKQLVEVFNNKPVEFDFDQLLAEFNKLD